MKPLDSSSLKRKAVEWGAAIMGVADLELLLRSKPDLLRNVGPGYTRAVVMGVPLSSAVLKTIVDQPTPIYAHHYQQVNYMLDRMALRMSLEIQKRGYEALPVPASQIIRNRPVQGHLSHKQLGWAAGLGHIGRSTLLVHPAYGARVRYVSVLTNMPLKPGEPSTRTCGTCHACMAICPAQAIHDTAVQYDLSACHARLEGFAKIPFVGQRICGLCVKVCRGQRAKR
ncbi:MAG: hypothetical protein V2A34_11570 [Lentisphaerota bacterium]